jgi:hypothetical protein
VARHLGVSSVSPFKKGTLNEGVKKKEQVSDKKDKDDSVEDSRNDQ